MTETNANSNSSLVVHQPADEHRYKVPHAARHVKGWRHFAGLFGGEHVAATEFVIGITFVTMGVGLFDVLVGLLIGNLLAVLSWRFVATPIAIETRLSLYAYMQKIVGPFVTKIFNVINILYYGGLAAAMITVAAYAVRYAVGIPVQLQWYPDSVAFVLVALSIATVVVLVASFGFDALADLSTICAPWLIASFVSGAFVALPALGLASFETAAPLGLGGLMEAASRFVWTGLTPEGDPGIGMWEVAGFAWGSVSMLNLGLVDMALFRFAKKPSYGYFSALGMFLGHYVAWIAAGLLGAGAALMLGTSLLKLDAGDVAFQIFGFTGIAIVVMAGWTTANACLYRGGLAASNLFPSLTRSRATLFVGIGVAFASCMPIVVGSVLPIMVYGATLLTPVGAIVATEHFLFPRMGLTRYWAEYRALRVSWPAVCAWGLSILFALGLWLGELVSFYWVFLPQYVFAGATYALLASFSGARVSYPRNEGWQYRQEQILSRFQGARDYAEAEGIDAKTPWWSKMVLAAAGCALLSMIGASVWVFLAGGGHEDYEAHRLLFQRMVLVLTLLYFALAFAAMRFQRD